MVENTAQQQRDQATVSIIMRSSSSVSRRSYSRHARRSFPKVTSSALAS